MVGNKMNRRLLVAILILGLATYMLTPRFWEPGGESWKQWAAARILRETGGFPVFSLGPLYAVYLQLFQRLGYPGSMQLEYLITHIFSYIAIFLMLRSALPAAVSLLLTCAWIPMIAVVEPGGAVAGMGFIALYFRGLKGSAFNKGYFPLSLLAAALCHSVFLAFLLGNLIGVFLEKRATKQPLLCFFHTIRQTDILPLVAKTGLLALVVLMVVFPSHRADHNHMLVDPTYMPIPLKDPLTIGFFQLGNWKYIMRTVPKSLWIYQDWYFTNAKVFGGATTILQALLGKSDTVARNILENVLTAIQLPRYFTVGNFRGPLAVIFWLLLPVGLIGAIARFRENGARQVISAVILGTFTVASALLLVCLTERYVMVLLPVMLLMVIHIGPGLWCSVKFLRNLNRQRLLFILGSLLILSGIIFNTWTLAWVSKRVLSFQSRLEIWSFDILLIIGAIFILIIYRTGFLTKVKEQHCLNTGAIVAVVCALLVFLTAAYPFGKERQIKAVWNNRGFLQQTEPVSMTMAYPLLLASLNKETRILAAEDLWIKAFAKVDLDRVYGAFNLPPFSDSSGKTERFLNSLDVIWVSSNWSEEVSSVSTQLFLRYELHVAPFLKKALVGGWRVQEVEGYGEIYRRPAFNRQITKR